MYFNGEKIPIKGFQDYVNLYLADKDPSQRIYEKVRKTAFPCRHCFGPSGSLRCIALHICM